MTTGTALRTVGMPGIDDVPWGTHSCHFYQTKEGLLDLLVPYFKAGLENHEFCLWVTSPPLDVKDSAHAMRKAVPHFDRYLHNQFEFASCTDWYLADGTFDIEQVVQRWIEKLDRSLARGYDGMRATGNFTWLDNTGWDEFVAYEEALDRAIRTHKILVLCTYRLDQSGPTEILDAVRNHQFALVERKGVWERLESAALQRTKAELAERQKADAVRTQLLNGIRTAQEEERKRIARELHDETGQLLTSLLVGLRTMRDAHTVQEAQEQAAHLLLVKRNHSDD